MQTGSACLFSSRNSGVSDVAKRSSCRGQQLRPGHLSACARQQQQTVLQVRRCRAPSSTAASAASWQHTASILEPGVQLDVQELLLDVQQQLQSSHAAAGPGSSSSTAADAGLQDCLCNGHTRDSSSNGASSSSYLDSFAVSSSNSSSSAASVCQHHQHHSRLGSLADVLVVQTAALGSSDSVDAEGSATAAEASASNVVCFADAASAAAAVQRNTGNGASRQQKHRGGQTPANEQQHWHIVQPADAPQQQQQQLEQHQQQHLWQPEHWQPHSLLDVSAEHEQYVAEHLAWQQQQQQHEHLELPEVNMQQQLPKQAHADLQQQQQLQQQQDLSQRFDQLQQQPGQLQQHSSMASMQHHQQRQALQQQQQHIQQQQQILHWQHQARLQQVQASRWLSARIAAAASWQEVRLLLDEAEGAPGWAPQHVVLLLVRLDQLLLLAPGLGGAAVPRPRHEQAEYVELVQTLLRMAGRLMPQLGHHDVPQLLAAAARLPLVRVSKPWCVAAMTRAHHTMHRLSPNSMATLTWALARLGMKFRADFQEKLLQEFKCKLHVAGPRALGVMVQGLAGVGARPDGLWVGVYLARVQQEMPWFRGHDLAMCLWGLVQLRHAVPAPLLVAALVRLTATLPQCSSHEASLAVWALGKLGHTFGSSSSRSPAAHAAGNSSSTTGSRQRQQQHVKQPWHGGLGKQQRRLLNGLKPKLAGMSGRDLVTLLYGLALQRSTPLPAWQAAAVAAALSKLHQLDGHGLSNLLHALGLLQWQPGRQWQAAFWNAVVTQIQLPQRQPKQQQQQQHGKGRQRQHQQQQGVASSWHVAGLDPQAGAHVSGAGYQAQPGFAPRTWELLLEGQRLLGWQLPLQQLHLLQRHGQLHRLGQAQLGSWARQAGLSAAAAAASGAPTLQPSGVQGLTQQAKLQSQPPQQQHPLHAQQQAQVQQQLRWSSSSSSSSGRSAAGSVSVQQLRVLPPVQRPVVQAGAQFVHEFGFLRAEA